MKLREFIEYFEAVENDYSPELADELFQNFLLIYASIDDTVEYCIDEAWGAGAGT